MMVRTAVVLSPRRTAAALGRNCRAGHTTREGGFFKAPNSTLASGKKPCSARLGNHPTCQVEVAIGRRRSAGDPADVPITEDPRLEKDGARPLSSDRGGPVRGAEPGSPTLSA